MRGECDNKEGDSNRAHPFPRVSRYKRGRDITKGDITEVRVSCVVKYQYSTF